MVESSSDDILKDADKVDIAFLVVGDPFGYVQTTTHMSRDGLMNC
jgi:diphthine synthase